MTRSAEALARECLERVAAAELVAMTLAAGASSSARPSPPNSRPLPPGPTTNPRNAAHAPAVHGPLDQGPNGLPIGVQVIGRIGKDARLLACAKRVERNLRK